MSRSNTRARGKKSGLMRAGPARAKDVGPASTPVGPHGRGQGNPPSAP